MTPEKPHEHRHQQPGRRKSDADDYRKAALVSAASDGLFPNWSRKKVAELLGIFLASATVYGMLTTWVASRFATRSELAPITMRIDTLTTRVDTLEAIRKRDAENDRRANQLFMGLVKLRCMEITEETAFLVGLPCDSILTPRQRSQRQ